MKAWLEKTVQNLVKKCIASGDLHNLSVSEVKIKKKREENEALK